jgi:hypothetical protein
MIRNSAAYVFPTAGIVRPDREGRMAVTSRELLRMSQRQLDTLFHASPAGDIPHGDGRGTAILAPGTRVGQVLARLTLRLAWQGKVVDARRGELVNKITALGIRAVKAQVYKAPSRFDGREAIILDYSKTSLLTRMVRDEVREVAPGTYLGQVYLGRARVANFALHFAGSPAEPPTRAIQTSR